VWGCTQLEAVHVALDGLHWDATRLGAGEQQLRVVNTLRACSKGGEQHGESVRALCLWSSRVQACRGQKRVLVCGAAWSQQQEQHMCHALLLLPQPCLPWSHCPPPPPLHSTVEITRDTGHATAGPQCCCALCVPHMR
jgi:hypothetical protein